LRSISEGLISVNLETNIENSIVEIVENLIFVIYKNTVLFMRYSLILVLLLALQVRAQSDFTPFQDSERYYVLEDLNDVVDDQIQISMVPPIQKADTAEFHMARIIPGTYDVHNYGQFVYSFSALNAQGDSLPIKRLDLNRWQILDAKSLYKITYRVADSYDGDISHDIFAPAGTSNEKDVFLLNNFGYIGYMKGFSDRPYQLQISKPMGFYGGTALEGTRTDSLDVFDISNYFELHDNPILYCLPDTASALVGDTKIEVSLYSPTGIVNAAQSLESIRDVLEGAAEYLGGKLPVDKYAVLIYCVPSENMGTSYGALEHNTSTVLYMPEMAGDFFYNGIRDITAHEFFHIVTPLSIHSQYIHNFDFIKPEMSEHIWLYEGVTEYNSHLVQMHNNNYTEQEFLEVLRDKLYSNDGFDSAIPLTLASKYTLSYFKDQYLNFYDKGALAALALDLKLMTLSEGEMRLIDLLEKLGELYPADTFFMDDELFEIITAQSFPQIEEFLLRHFAGTESLPFTELLQAFGFDYSAVGVSSGWSLGCDDFSYSFESSRIIIAKEEGIDEFGHELGFRPLDELISINGDTLDIINLGAVIENYQTSLSEGDKVEVVIARPKKKEGEYKIKTLKAVAREIEYEESHLLKATAEPSLEQLRMRKIWLGY
jgi:predicted metalloprotease with PDZ domain